MDATMTLDDPQALDSPTDPGNPQFAAPTETSTRGGWKGRVAAALVGGSLLAFAIGLFVTIYVPGADGLDEAFMGGLTLVVLWPLVMLWILFAESTGRAWRRAMVPFLLITILDVAGLML